MKIISFLKNTKKIEPVNEPEILIMVAPPGSGKTYVSKKYKNTHIIIDVDELRDEPDNIENIDEEQYRIISQSKAEQRRNDLLERMVLERKNIILHVVTGSDFWYKKALDIKYSGYKVKFVFFTTTIKEAKNNLKKRIERDRNEKGYAIISDNKFLKYSFESIPKLLITTLKDEDSIVDEVVLLNKEGIPFENYSKEDIYRGLKTEYIKKD